MKTNKQFWKEARRGRAISLNTYRTAPAGLDINHVSCGQLVLNIIETYEEFLAFLDRMGDDYKLYTHYLIDDKEIQLTFQQIQNPGIQITFRCKDAIRIAEEYLNLECKSVKVINNNSYTSYSLECTN